MQRFFFKDWKKGKTKMNKIDFINIRGQQSFLENTMNIIKIRIENDMVRNKIWKYKKITAKFALEGLFFSSSVQNQTQNFFITTTALLDAKYSFVYRKIYQAIGAIKLNEINGREKILKISSWVHASFQSQLVNWQTQHFAYSFISKIAGDILDFAMQ